MFELAFLRYEAGDEQEAIGLVQRAALLGLPEARRALLEEQHTVRLGRADLVLTSFRLDFSGGPAPFTESGSALSRPPD
jgi:hypothetical protein